MTRTQQNTLVSLRPHDDAPLHARSDDELMLLTCQGLQAALSELMRRYEGRVRSYCSKWNAARGDDLAQEVFVALWRTRERYRPEGRFPVYLFTLVRNRCRNSLRELFRWQRLFEGEAPAATDAPDAHDPGALDALLAAENQRRVRAELARLTPKLREAILLRFDQGLSYAELAEILGVPENTARARVFQGLRKLRERWPEDQTPDGEA